MKNGNEDKNNEYMREVESVLMKAYNERK